MHVAIWYIWPFYGWYWTMARLLLSSISPAIKSSPRNYKLYMERSKLYEAIGDQKNALNGYKMMLKFMPEEDGEKCLELARSTGKVCTRQGYTSRSETRRTRWMATKWCWNSCQRRMGRNVWNWRGLQARYVPDRAIQVDRRPEERAEWLQNDAEIHSKRRRGENFGTGKVYRQGMYFHNPDRVCHTCLLEFTF